MKKIDTLMNGGEQYSIFIEQLSNILEPFALLVRGYTPIYYGRKVESISMGLCQDHEGAIFSINEEKVALVNTVHGEASIYGREFVQLTSDDLQSVIEIVNAIKATGQESNINTISGLPKELQDFMEDIFRNGGGN